MGSSEAPAPVSFVASVLSSSVAPVLASSGAPVPAIPLLPPSGEDIFAAVVPRVRSSFYFAKKKVAG